MLGTGSPLGTRDAGPGFACVSEHGATRLGAESCAIWVSAIRGFCVSQLTAATLAAYNQRGSLEALERPCLVVGWKR
eukprot:1532896-Prymnesium_polylepis.1